MQSLEAATVPSGLNAGLADVTGAGAIGLFLGDGVMPIPQKLVNKILALEYVEMRLLLPESWLYEENGTHCCDKRDRSKKPEIRSIFPWLQSFSAMVGVLASRYPHKTEKKLNDVIAENQILTRRIAELEKEQEGTSQKVGQLKEENHQLREKHDNLERELDTRIVLAPVPPFYCITTRITGRTVSIVLLSSWWV